MNADHEAAYKAALSYRASVGSLGHLAKGYIDLAAQLKVAKRDMKLWHMARKVMNLPQPIPIKDAVYWLVNAGRAEVAQNLEDFYVYLVDREKSIKKLLIQNQEQSIELNDARRMLTRIKKIVDTR